MTNENIPKIFAEFIDDLVHLQLQHEPFSNMNLTSIEIIRAKTCLAIYDWSYFFHGLSALFMVNKEKAKSISDNTFQELDIIYRREHLNTDITIPDLVINNEEQKKILTLAKTWGHSLDLNVILTPSILFPMLCDIRVPSYVNAINEAIQNVENNLAAPFFPVTRLFHDHFLKEPLPKFLVEFDLEINPRTFSSMTKIINEFITHRAI